MNPFFEIAYKSVDECIKSQAQELEDAIINQYYDEHTLQVWTRGYESKEQFYNEMMTNRPGWFKEWLIDLVHNKLNKTITTPNGNTYTFKYDISPDYLGDVNELPTSLSKVD